MALLHARGTALDRTGTSAARLSAVPYTPTRTQQAEREVCRLPHRSRDAREEQAHGAGDHVCAAQAPGRGGEAGSERRGGGGRCETQTQTNWMQASPGGARRPLRPPSRSRAAGQAAAPRWPGSRRRSPEVATCSITFSPTTAGEPKTQNTSAMHTREGVPRGVHTGGGDDGEAAGQQKPAAGCTRSATPPRSAAAAGRGAAAVLRPQGWRATAARAP